MLSRTADHLFWMARYTERAEKGQRPFHQNTAEARSACGVLGPGARHAE